MPRYKNNYSTIIASKGNYDPLTLMTQLTVMYGLYMHWPSSTFACKCDVHRILLKDVSASLPYYCACSVLSLTLSKWFYKQCLSHQRMGIIFT